MSAVEPSWAGLPTHARTAHSAGRFRDLIQEALDCLRSHDETHRSELIRTLRAYMDSGFSLAGAAQNQRVQPNTVKYRLHRIYSLTGHDPFDLHDILLFGLALLCR